jgi:hypothetical protein
MKHWLKAMLHTTVMQVHTVAGVTTPKTEKYDVAPTYRNCGRSVHIITREKRLEYSTVISSSIVKATK